MKTYDVQHCVVVVCVIYSDNSVPVVVVAVWKRRRRCCNCHFVRISRRCRRPKRRTPGNQRSQRTRWWPMGRPRTLEQLVAARLRQLVARRRLWRLDERRRVEERWRRLAVSRTREAQNTRRTSQNSSLWERTLDDGGKATYSTPRQTETVDQRRVGPRGRRAGDAVVCRAAVQRRSTLCRRRAQWSCSLSLSPRYHWNPLWTK